MSKTDESRVSQKTYSPDIAVYSFEETSAVYKTLSSILVGPIRLVMRVMHNIPLLPGKLLVEYTRGLFLVCGAFSFVGLFDYVFYGKWPMLVSQPVVFLIALHLKRKCRFVAELVEEVREVEIDEDQVNACCNKIFSRLDEIVGNTEEK